MRNQEPRDPRAGSSSHNQRRPSASGRRLEGPAGYGEAPRRNAPTRRAPAERPVADDPKAAARKAAFRRKNKKLDILIVSLSGLLLVSIAFAIFLPAQLRANPASLPSSVPSASIEDDYNMNANSLPVEELIGTILPESEDAGVEYLEETLFIGDSNTVRMMNYSDITHVSLNNGIGVEGMGIHAVTTLPCVKFKGYTNLLTIPDAVEIMQPRRIIITFGTNNAGGMGTDSFIASYKKALEAIHDAYPYTDIIIGAVPPVAQRHMNESITMTTIDQYNVALAKLAEEMGHKFLNWSEVLKDASTGFAVSGYMLENDGVHFSRNAMEPMFNYVRTHSYISEDTRPKPLKDIPERGETPPGLIISDPKGGTSASAASSSSSVAATVNVSVSAYDRTNNTAGGGTITVNGQSVTATTLSVATGGTVPDIVATPNAGYRFVGWACSVGSIANTSSTTLSGFKIYPTVTAGETVTITATFEKEVVSSSSSSAPQTPVTVSVVAGAGGTAQGTAQVMPGGTVNVSAAAAEGYRFIGWSGPVADPSNPNTTVTVPTDAAPGSTITVTANFEAVAPPVVSSEAPPVVSSEAPPAVPPESAPVEGGEGV